MLQVVATGLFFPMGLFYLSYMGGCVKVHEGKQQNDAALVSYHGKGHSVDLMFVFGLVLSEWTVPARKETECMQLNTECSASQCHTEDTGINM